MEAGRGSPRISDGHLSPETKMKPSFIDGLLLDRGTGAFVGRRKRNPSNSSALNLTQKRFSRLTGLQQQASHWSENGAEFLISSHGNTLILQDHDNQRQPTLWPEICSQNETSYAGSDFNKKSVETEKSMVLNVPTEQHDLFQRSIT